MSAQGILPTRATRSRGMRRPAIYSAVLITSVVGVYLATKASRQPSTAVAHHHGAGAASNAASAQPVSLTPAQERRIGVTYAVATLGPLETEVRTIGQITYDETRVRTITVKVDGFVERLLVNATGQPVSVGEPLLTIYSPMLVQAEEDLLLAKRLQSDVAEGNSDARRGATELLESSRRRLAWLDIPASDIAAIEQSGTVRRTLTLRSPASGHVLEKNVVAGQKIMAGEPLYRVADLATVWVEGEIFEQDLANVRTGQAVHADFQALPGEHRTGRIAYVYPTVDPDTRTARVRIVLPNGSLRLKPGMYATLRIVGSPRAAVLTVPRSAVLSTGERNMVFVRDSAGRLVPREVSLGATNDDRIEIVRGLAAGETVVASATFLVDAESNLATGLGGMGDMPGMELNAPPRTLPMQETPATAHPAPAHAGRRAPEE